MGKQNDKLIKNIDNIFDTSNLNEKRKDPIDILELYTTKVINREKQKKYFKQHPELWIKKMYKQKALNKSIKNQK